MPKKYIKAIDALQEAQKIAFAPFVFQTTVSLKNLGVFDFIFKNVAKGGVTLQEISKELSISEYGLGVLLEMAESSEIVSMDERGRYELTKIGYFLNYNPMTKVNMNFTQDVCYQGLYHLEEAIREGKPAGLKELGNWKTIYEGLSQLKPEIQKSWFDFDHFYSDGIFEEALKVVFRHQPKLLFDIGGNTGKFAVQCCAYNEEVNVHIFDLPGQLKVALKNTADQGFGNRVEGTEIDWLSENPKIPAGADTIWMSQFLDCFSKEEILKILRTAANAMDSDTELILIETYTDRQKFDNAKFTLEATSLYFTAMANGNSKMYKATDLMELVEQAGLEVRDDISLGEFHTLFVCKKS
ncbi:methyltransferase [Maribacter cobaltidurans]|uniref:SAM-dependent methyltransferase n=1 Tax=Maribacter cobaltidurans TaxID=1178778 RepID=A0A223V345_9FLAO|nr:methyltransferase [Maribacter cobaltidurans]ASV29825.1 SAM-dependent methyltransferase [Maribacter cobaltidurans]GGD92173.1 O-methyltransferase [Maribacter cobaltidurans]